MASLRFNIELDQGSDYLVSWPIVNAAGEAQTVSSWTGAMQVRQSVDATDVLADLGGRLTLSESTVSLSVPGNVSSDWTWRYGFYDLELTSPSGKVSRVGFGRFVVNPEITR